MIRNASGGLRLLIDQLFADLSDDERSLTLRTVYYCEVWHWVDRMTLQEVAEAAAMSVSGVRKRLRTLRARVVALHPELQLPEVTT